MRKIAVVTGTRAEYGLSRTIFEAIQEHPKLTLDVIVTGMHLMEEFGYSARLIEADGIKIAHNTHVVQKGDTGYDGPGHGGHHGRPTGCRPVRGMRS